MYTARDYEALFTEPVGEELVEQQLRHNKVAAYCARTIRSGKILECEAYPIWNTRGEAGKAREARGKTRPAQQRVNQRNAEKRLVRRLNANFGEQDLFVTITYKGEVPDETEARRHVQNYIRRVKAWRKREGLGEMKYIYVIEFDDGRGTLKRVHYHLVMSGMDRNAAEKLWKNGGRVQTRRLQPDENGLEGLGRYMLKAASGSRRCSSSLNLKEPIITRSMSRMSRRRVRQLADGLRYDGKAILEQVYPGYMFVELQVRRSDFVSGAYVYSKMRKQE